MTRTAALCVVALCPVVAATACTTSGPAATRPGPTANASAPSTSEPEPEPKPTPTSPELAPAALQLPHPVGVVGLGDSVTAAAHCDCSGFVADYGVLIHRRYDVPVHAVEYGVSGGTTSSLLAQLRATGDEGVAARAVADADVVSLTIGANDLEAARAEYDNGSCGGPLHLACFTPAIARMKAGLAADLAQVRSLTGFRPVQLLVNTYWNVFEDGAVALREDGQQYLQDSDLMTRRANVAICAAAHAAGAVCVDTYAPFKGSNGRTDPTHLLAADGDHPDAAGHEVIARVMAEAGLPALLGG